MQTWFIVSWDNGDCKLNGPFPDRTAAEAYAYSAEESGHWDPSEWAFTQLTLEPKA